MSIKLKLEIRAEIHRDGKLVKRYPWKRANSLLRQFIQILTVQLGLAPIVMTDTGGTATRSLTQSGNNFYAAAAAASTVAGIQIGTGTTPVAMTDIKIETQSVTNVAYGICVVSVENPDASTWRSVVTRTFTNNTGSVLNITEIALVCWGGNTPWFFCIDHTLYSVSVPSGSSVTLTYRITISL